MHSEQFQVRVIKYPNSIKLMHAKSRSPPKTAGADNPREDKKRNLRVLKPQTYNSRGLHDQF